MKLSKTTPTDPSLDIYVPAGLRESRRYNDRVIVAGRGPIPSDLMFISASVLEEESADAVQGVFGASFNRKPAYLKGGVGIALKDLCTSVGISVDAEVYYTALCKWQLPKNEVLNPKRGKCEPGIACLIRELEEVKPKVVVAFGKAVFEFLCPGVIKFGEGLGMWFWSAEYQCRVMPMSHQQYILTKPEWFEDYRLNLQQVKQMWDETRGIEVSRVPLNYSVCYTADDLRVLVEILKDFYLYSIDCEWHGFSHVDGHLRSLQICWAPGCASYIRFMDDQLNYVFDVSYEEAGAILAPVWNRKAVELVGHHISADLPWTSTKLGLEWYRKTRLDTEFAYQCCDEHGKRGLEWMSIRYTDLGRYEMELEVWKKKNKDLCEGGYGRIPDDILIPYGCKDVDVPMRAYLQIEADLRRQGMLHYYRDIMNPFCTDVFTQFALTGLPMNVPAMHEMREVYSFARSEMEAEFRQTYYEEAWDLLATHCMLVACPWPSDMPEKTRRGLTEIARAPQSIKLRLAFEAAPDMLSGTAAVMSVILTTYGEIATTHATVQSAVAHATSAKIQKIDSTDNKKRWLFDLKGYTPIKSTNNKAKGVPTMSWEKVMALKPEQREGISPAVDKQTIQILADTHSDALLKSLLTLQAVATVIKSFLSEPERDEEGAIIEEAGLLIWVSSDQRIHGHLSMTETGRPRAWKPNILNWPSGVQDKIRDGIKAAVLKANAEGRLPAALNCYAEGKKILSLRGTVQVPEDDILIESDYVTAEVLGLAYISGDANLIRIMTEPDSQFGVLNDKDGTPVRIGYAPDCGITQERQDPRCLMSVWSEGKMIKQVDELQLVRKPDGTFMHPRVDLHWQLAESFQSRPREFLSKDKERKAGKIGNFQTAYGATPATLERKYESDTGLKPTEGLGQSIMDALDVRQKVAQEWLVSLESAPENPGYLRAVSGKVRHFVKPHDAAGHNSRLRRSIMSAQGREARNFFMQESVASTAGRAAIWLMDFGRHFKLKGITNICLYDSLATWAPRAERLVWAKAHKLFMHLANGWAYHGRVLRYSIDTEFNLGWSLRPSKDELIYLDDPTHKPTPEHLKAAEQWLDTYIAYYAENEKASLTFPGWRS